MRRERSLLGFGRLYRLRLVRLSTHPTDAAHHAAGAPVATITAARAAAESVAGTAFASASSRVADAFAAEQRTPQLNVDRPRGRIPSAGLHRSESPHHLP